MKHSLVTFLLITVRLLPAFYYLTLLLSGAAELITDTLFDVYAITFRPFVYSLLMLCLLWILSLDKLDWFNKYFWCWVRGDRPYQIIYLWLSLIVGVFGIACFASGLATVFMGSDSQFSMFNIRDDIFYPAAAAFILCPFFMTWHILRKNSVTLWLEQYIYVL